MIEAFGWYGVGAILIAYSFNVFHVLESSSQIFLWLNLTGSAGVVAVSWKKHTYQPLVLNSIWFAIAAFGLLQALT